MMLMILLFIMSRLRREIEIALLIIYSTQGHWKMPRGTKRTRTYWFVYSYFNFGPYAYINPNCGEFDSILQKNILELAESMITISRYTGNKGRFILMPTLVGSEYPTE